MTIEFHTRRIEFWGGKHTLPVFVSAARTVTFDAVEEPNSTEWTAFISNFYKNKNGANLRKSILEGEGKGR